MGYFTPMTNNTREDGWVKYEETDTDIVKTTHNFGIQDEKGREIGAIITTFIVTRTQIDDPENSWGCICDPKHIGTHIAYRAQATRNGKMFGASQQENWCETEQERNEKIEKYLADAKKRASKKLAK